MGISRLTPFVHYTIDGNLFTTRKQSCGKVMFSVVSVCHCIHGRSPCDHYPCCIGPHHTGTPSPLGMGPHYAGTPGGREWKPIQTCSPEDKPPTSAEVHWPRMETCSNLFTWGPPPSTDIWWLLKHIYIWLTSGRYTSYWNVFLLTF